MLPKMLGTILVLIGLNAPRSLAAQTTVTLELPVNLTQLSPAIDYVVLACTINSAAIVLPAGASPISGEDKLPVVGGKLVTVMRVVVVFPEGTLQNPIGKTATYGCVFAAHNKVSNGTAGFSEAPSDPAFYLKPTPPTLQGSFVW